MKLQISNLSRFANSSSAWCVPWGPILQFSMLILAVFSGCNMKITRHYEKVSSVRLIE